MEQFFGKYWQEGLFAVLVAIFGGLYRRLSKKVKKEFCDNRASKNGTKALLREQIINSYEKYMSKEWIPIYALESVLSMYEAYHGLGGNGAVTELVEKLKELPNIQHK